MGRGGFQAETVTLSGKTEKEAITSVGKGKEIFGS